MSIPKVLIIDSGYLLGTGGTAETMRNLFSSFPRENILNICVNPYVIIDNKEYYDRVCILPQFCLTGRFLAGKIYHFFRGEKIENSPVLKENRTGHIVSSQKKALSALADLFPLLIDRETNKRVEAFSPDIIYTTGASIRVFEYALKFSRICNKRILIHYLDDYINYNVFSNCAILSVLNRVLLKKNKRCLEKSNCILCISQKMAEEYSKKFNLDAYVAMNTCKEASRYYVTRHDPITLLYCGSMNINRDRVLIKICNAVNDINMKGNCVVFNIYSSSTEWFNKYFDSYKPQGVFLKGLVDHDVMQQIIKDSDVCVYAENMDDESANYCRLSFSTKIGEFMACAKPILCVAPGNIAVFEYLKKIGNAYLVSNEINIIEGLTSIISDTNYRSKSKLSYMHYVNDLSWSHIIESFHKAVFRSANQ